MSRRDVLEAVWYCWNPLSNIIVRRFQTSFFIPLWLGDDFRPNGDVRGSYMVSTTNTNFTATGISDVDGDGVYATYQATKSENPNAPTTAPDVY